MVESNNGSSSNMIISDEDHNPNAPGEAMTLVRLPREISNITLEYLGEDIIIKPNSLVCNKPITLFGKNCEALWAAKNILQGNGKEIDQLLALVKNKPDLLRVKTSALDLLGRSVKGTLLQIAVMAGDVDFKINLTNDKDRGIAERLLAVGNLSHAEINSQLECITSPDAVRMNEERNQRVLRAVERLGQGLIMASIDSGIRSRGNREWCRALLDQFDEDLKFVYKEINAGYLFDLKILYDAIDWFQKHVEQLGGIASVKSDVFWVSCYGKLQSLLSYRDAEMIDVGCMDKIVDAPGLAAHHGYGPCIPSRQFGPSTMFFNPESKLGIDYFITFHGSVSSTAPLGRVEVYIDGYNKVMANKRESIEKLANYTKIKCFGCTVL